MRKSTVFCAGCAAIALMVHGARATAAQPSANKMSQMGLAGAHVVSDSAAMHVRGHGYSGSSRIWGTVKINGVVVRRYNTTSSGSQSNSTFVAVPVGGNIFLVAGGSSSVKVGGQ
jgi:hypothetical protein